MIHEEIGWNTQAMAMMMKNGRDVIDPATAAIIVREFESCPVCGNNIDPEASDGLREDRDVIWENSNRHESNAHSCHHCDSELRIFVEEKAFGIIPGSRLPESAENNETLHFVPIDGRDSYLQVNTFQMSVSEVKSDNSSSDESGSIPA